MRPDIRWHPRAIAAGLRGRLRALFSRTDIERELDDEMRFHLDMEIEKNLEHGMTRADAERAARIAFGGFDRVAEAHRDARGARVVEDAMADMRHSMRALSRTPGFVVVSILTLTIAIAIGTLGFTVANAFFYRPLPVPDGSNVLSIFTSDWSGRGKAGGSSYADIIDFAREAEPIADISGESRIMLTFSVNDEVTYAQGAVVTSRYFRVARIRPALGRFPVSSDAPTIVISHSLWRRSFAADTAVIGRKVLVNGRPFSIAAVAPDDFRGINRENGVDFWLDGALAPLVLLDDQLITRRGYRSFRAVGRLRDGGSLDALNARLAVAGARLFQANPQSWRDTTGGGRLVTVLREQDAHLANMSRTDRLLMVGSVVGFGLGLVILACMNLASLQMARAASRRREIATRLALGAGRWRLIRQLLAECALVAVPGIGMGVAIAVVVSALMSHFRPIPLPSWDLTLDWRTMSFIAGGLLITLLVFGLLPALQAVRADVLTDLKGGEQPGPRGLRIGGVRGGLIITQVACAMTFTAFAGLIALGLVRHANEGRGEASKVLISRVNFLPAAGDSDQVETVFNEVLDGIRQIPGVTGVSASAFIPIRGSRSTVMAQIASRDGVEHSRELDVNNVRPGYLGLIGIPILRGRDFDQRDRAAPAAIVSKAMAEALWPGEDPLGKRIKLGRREPAVEILEVVGVAADPAGFTPATAQSHPGLLYLRLGSYREAEMVLHIGAPDGQDAIAGQVTQLLRRYNRQLVAPRPITLDEYYDRMLLPVRLMAQGSGALAALQFLLAVAGLSGLIAYVTELRRREIGIRTALGATRMSVLRLVMRQGVRLTAIGGGLGLIVSGMVAREIASSLPMTSVVLAGGLLAAAVVFTIVGTIAMLVPARRALDVVPAVALRVD